MSLDNSNTGNGTGQRIDFTFSSSPYISITGRKEIDSYGGTAALIIKHHRSHVQSDGIGFARFSMFKVSEALGGATGYTGTGAAAAAPSFFVSTGSIYVETGNVSGSSTSTGSFGEGHFVGQHVGIGVKNTSGNTLYVNSVGNGQSARFSTDNVLNYIHITNSGGANHYIETNQHSIALAADANNNRGSVHLKTGNTNRLNVTSDGHVEPGADNSYNLGSSTKRWANIHSADLHLSNEDTEGNEVDGTTGNWTIQEGEDDLFILNKKNGKKYRFKLEEIT